MKKICLVALIMFHISKGHAGMDFNFAGNYRSYPLGGSGEINIGYGIMLWGNQKNNIYGFLRPAVDYEAVADYQAQTVKLELFPISLLGLRAGSTWVQNHNEYKDFDCSVYICRGNFREEFLETQTYLGFKRFLLSFSLKNSSFYNAKVYAASWVEPSSGLLMSSLGRDEMTRARGIALIDVTPNWRVGYMAQHYKEDKNLLESQMWLGLLQFHYKDFSLVFGGGEYRSDLKTTDPTFTINVNYALLPKLGF